MENDCSEGDDWCLVMEETKEITYVQTCCGDKTRAKSIKETRLAITQCN